MTVQLELDGEMGAFAETLAERDGISVEVLLSKAAQEYLSGEQREEALLDERFAEAERGEVVWISSEEMDERVKKMLQRG